LAYNIRLRLATPQLDAEGGSFCPMWAIHKEYQCVIMKSFS
jgi:hypothetical protein